MMPHFLREKKIQNWPHTVDKNAHLKLIGSPCSGLLHSTYPIYLLYRPS